MMISVASLEEMMIMIIIPPPSCASPSPAPPASLSAASRTGRGIPLGVSGRTPPWIAWPVGMELRWRREVAPWSADQPGA
jgi:hypothetical protein